MPADSARRIRVFDLQNQPRPEVVPTTCTWCTEPFQHPDVVIVDLGGGQHHKECLMRAIFGSLGHLKRACSCYGGTEEDPPHVSRRDAALLAYLYRSLPASAAAGGAHAG